MPKTFFVIRPEEGQDLRMDIYLSQKLPQLSRSSIQRLIRDSRVKINSQNVKTSYRLKSGDKVEVDIPLVQKPVLLPEDIPIKCLFEDETVLVIDKPSGLVVHPGAGTTGSTLVNALLYHWPSLRDVGDRKRPGIVHRLDKETSGVMVVAKTQLAFEELQRQFKAREVKKTYLGLVWGKMPEKAGRFTWAIGRHVKKRQRISIRTDKPKTAETLYTVQEEWSEFSLLEITPFTGRTHQIRVHLAASGHPVVGDTRYGRKKPKFKTQRLFLHSFQLEFTHPEAKKRRQFSAPLPRELSEALKNLPH